MFVKTVFFFRVKSETSFIQYFIVHKGFTNTQKCEFLLKFKEHRDFYVAKIDKHPVKILFCPISAAQIDRARHKCGALMTKFNCVRLCTAE